MQNKFMESIANTVLLLLFFMAAVSYNGKLFGHKAEDLFSSEKDEIEIIAPTTSQLGKLGISEGILKEEKKGVWITGENFGGDKVINTLAFSKGVYGFGGPTPLLLQIDSSNKIKNILLLENNETPDFIASIKSEGIIDQWMGKDYQEMSSIKPDILSGATMTSSSINRSILNSLQAISNGGNKTNWLSIIDTKSIVAILVILLAVFVSFRAKSNKHLRTLQLVLNTAILGFWCGKFISINVLLGWTANGMNLLTSSAVFLMLVLAIVMPLFFKKKSFYCNWVCPFGSAQELAGKLSKKKFHPSQKFMKILKHSQSFITLAVFFSLWLGMASDIVDYEPFSAFIFQHASLAVICIAVISLVISIITPRPWCRFVCPTGQILNWTNKM
ncbi:FMN-binding protein [Marinifilum caeruleilacunae]|uniref:4Fe-4S binding protein n=1 Tax=Marinifilum caeruleilacunae TaxID=2499076 RepID=A0ABX1WQC8_9BACT|nr:4Fe-4S binding protein [Marinifilum caeruleilacunae]NOU58286.1 4Fe-4S binding protein [Marinifilum caeruleilacunae]